MKIGKNGTIAEKMFRKLMESHDIALEDGSPSKSSDFSIFPNILAEVKSCSGSAYYFSDANGRGARQWAAIREKLNAFPWLEAVYPVYFTKIKEWRWYNIPEPDATPLRMKDGMPINSLIVIVKERQRQYKDYWSDLSDDSKLENLNFVSKLDANKIQQSSGVGKK